MLTAALYFQVPLAWLGLIPAALFLAFAGWRHQRRGLLPQQMLALIALRGVPLILLVTLAARPVWLSREPPASAARSVVVLLDRSESMSLQEQDITRYQKAVDFMRERLLPALKSAKLPVQAMLFDKTAEAADGGTVTSTSPKGERTNLGGAIAQAVGTASQPPLAVVALTDGSANENGDNTRGLTALTEAGIPFIGVGFGSDRGVRTLSLREVDAPPVVPTKTSFSISAQLEMMNAEDLPAFDLVLMRDGQIKQKKSVTPGKGSRLWLENFQVNEDQQGVHNYTVQLFPPNLADLRCINTLGNTSVRISDDKELRVLYVQGALTWDYKFISMALRGDPTIKLTGLTRTSKQSVFRQNVENAGELLNGFPNSLEELAPFRVVVLSNLRPADLTVPQQEVLARFCGELGGGILMIGGPSTFDTSWQRSKLEQLLPVVFAANTGVQGLDRPFRIQPTDDALQHPVFQIADNAPARDVWSQLPAFTQYGRVDAPKPGAQVWMLHQTDDGPHGRRILMASQHYGAGLSAVLTIQNFWRWRLARDSEPQQFDRFWRQLFRFLSEVGRQEVAIHLADQELHPDMDVQVILEKQPNPKNVTDTNRKFFVRVEDSQKKVLQDEAVELEPLRPVDFKFHAATAGVYTVSVSDSLRVPTASRAVEIRNMNVEFQDTARNMETLRQWASVSDGLAMKAEDCRDANDLVRAITTKIEQVRKSKQLLRPLGVNAWVLAVVAGCLAGEWTLRKRWGLV
ncbi:MAG TPA: vWA domain-containing protein [Candidatus Dormibacteraeota bacterium]|nr:vWA domain-containing protein [Candidatus Dormibacteraeota bacterium]